MLDWSKFSTSQHLSGVFSFGKLVCLEVRKEQLKWVEDSIQGKKQDNGTIVEMYIVASFHQIALCSH